MSLMMSARRKRPAALAAAACLLIAAFVFGFALPSVAAAWDDCPKGVTTDCVYPGACGHYIDTNGDDICDRSQSDPALTTTTAAAANTVATTVAATNEADVGEAAAVTAAGAVVASAAPTTTTTVPGSGGSGGSPAAALAPEAGTPLLTRYLVSPIAIGFFLIYGISFFLYKTKRMRVATHRKIWNVLLLATFLITGIFGIILTIQLDYRLPFTMPINLLFWHVEAGIVMTLISLFHMGWHFNYYRNLVRKSRCKARAAEAAERLRTAEQRQLALQARAARHVEHDRRRAREDAPQTIRREMSPRPWIEPEAQ